MKIGTVVILKIIDVDTLATLDTTSGPTANTILPRIDECIELETVVDNVKESELYKVTTVVHKYETSYRNIIEIYVRKFK